jgi:hypothetical protein
MGVENACRTGSGISDWFIQKPGMHSNVGTHINKYIITTSGQPLSFANRNYFFPVSNSSKSVSTSGSRIEEANVEIGAGSQKK